MSQPTKNPTLATSIPGPKSRALREKEDHVLAPGLQGFALMAGLVVKEARGSWITDMDGNVFLDLIGGIGVNGLGHSHPYWIEKIQEQIQKVSVGSFTSESRVRLLEKLSEWAPCTDSNSSTLSTRTENFVTQLYSSGAEAVESALRLAKNYTGKSEVVSFWGGFHGKTQGVLSLMGSNFKKSFGPFVPGSCVVPYPDPDRVTFQVDSKLSPQALTKACIEFAEKQVSMNLNGDIAAIIVEPIQGTAGNVIPPDDFLIELQVLAKKWGALLICDEMITGFGRSGKKWGCAHSGICPDILTIGKQFGGGFPISAVMAKKNIAHTKPWGAPSGSSSSYGGNPLASAAALAALEIIENEKLVERSNEMGTYFLEKLKSFENRYDFISKVRGRGLMLAIDFAESDGSELTKSKCQQIFEKCLQRGLLTMSYAPRFRLQPAMTIQREEINTGVAILEEVFDEIQKNGFQN